MSTQAPIIAYHGTSEVNAKLILDDGFRPGTFFAYHLENALGFGGEYVFQVMFSPSKRREKKRRKYLAARWQFVAHDGVPPDRIISLNRYKVKNLVEHKDRRDAIFKANLALHDKENKRIRRIRRIRRWIRELVFWKSHG